MVSQDLPTGFAQIDRVLGKKYAAEFGRDHEYLKRLQESIERDDKWLTDPTEE